MSGKSINFDDEKINKSSFYKSEKLFNIDVIDINKILISKKDSYGKKDHLNTSLDIMMMMMMMMMIMMMMMMVMMMVMMMMMMMMMMMLLDLSFHK